MDLFLDSVERRRQIEDSIGNSESKIRQLERAHESLRAFKTAVQQSHGDFEGVNTRKTQILQPLQAKTAQNRAAKEYDKGMRMSLNSVGMNVVGMAFNGLLSGIDYKLREYRRAIMNEEWNLSYLQARLREVDDETGAGSGA